MSRRRPNPFARRDEPRRRYDPFREIVNMRYDKTRQEAAEDLVEWYDSQGRIGRGYNLPTRRQAERDYLNYVRRGRTYYPENVFYHDDGDERTGYNDFYEVNFRPYYDTTFRRNMPFNKDIFFGYK